MINLPRTEMTPEQSLFAEVLRVAWMDAFLSEDKVKRTSRWKDRHEAIQLFTEGGKWRKHLEFLCAGAGIEPKAFREDFNYYFNNKEEYFKILKKVRSDSNHFRMKEEEYDDI